MNISKYKSEFINYIKVSKNISNKTIMAYCYDLLDYFLFIEKYKRIIKRKNIILSYLDYLQNNKKLKDNTIQRRLITLKMYYNYMSLFHKVKNPFNTIKIKLKQQQRLPRLLSINEVKIILHTIESKISNKSIYTLFEGYRDLALIDVLISSGIRIGEASNIKLTDLDLNNKTILINGKNRKQRMIYLSSLNTIDNIDKYIYYRNKIAKDDYLFISRLGYKISIHSIDNIFRKYKKLSNINQDCTPHYLRHTFATNLLTNGADIRSVQELLGHCNISITEIYTQVTNNRKIEVLDKYNYRNNI